MNTKPDICKRCKFLELPFNEFPCTTCEVYSRTYYSERDEKFKAWQEEERRKKRERPIEPDKYYDYDEFYGLHKLSGVDILEGNDEDEGRKCVFILDSVKYCGCEDPDDGYRSYMGRIFSLKYDTTVQNIFPCEDIVICGYNSYDEDLDITSEGLQFLNAKTGQPVLILGTVALDDYYPSCRMEWYPENLQVNLKRKD